MTSDLSSVSRGQKVRIQAGTWNRILALARGQSDESSAPSDLTAIGDEPIDVRNDTGAYITSGSILGLGDLVITPTDDTLSWQSQVVLEADLPAWPGSKYIAVSQETIAPDAVGKAVISGLAWVKVEITNSGLPKYARPIADDITKLQLDWWGPCKIVAREAGTSGTKWALVEIGSFYDHRYIGKATAYIAARGTGTVTVYEGIASDAAATDGTITSVFSRYVAIPTSKEVRVAWDNDGPEIDNREC